MRTFAQLMVPLGLVLVAACSSSSATDSGAVWPDLILDAPQQDALSDPDLGPDLFAPDVGPDGPAVDVPPSMSWQNTQVVGNPNLHAVACLSGGHVFVAGASGTLLHRGPTSPPGIVFTKQQVGAPATATDLHTVTFADPTYGVTAGKSWEIWETKDLGQTWATAPQCSAFVFDTFYSLHLDSATTGFGAGIAVNNQGAGFKYYTGTSWICNLTPYPGEVFYDVFRLGKNGWVVGQTGGKIYRTEDDGTSLTPISVTPSETLRALHFQSPNLGLAVGDKGTILRSTDGDGKVWAAVSSGVTADLYGVTMVDASTGWAVGAGGMLLLTTDGGQSWTPEPSGVGARLEAICFTSAQEGWAVGQAGTVIHTKTGGIAP